MKERDETAYLEAMLDRRETLQQLMERVDYNRRHRGKKMMTGRNDELVELRGTYIRDSDSGKAALFKFEGTPTESGKATVWLPHSQIEIDGELRKECEVAMPQWLAEEKELI